MLILERIFDSLLFLSKKEIYKERKFSFLSYQNRRFWGKDEKNILRFEESSISVLLFGISKKFHENARTRNLRFRYSFIEPT